MIEDSISEAKKKLIEMNKLISSLDLSIRAAAFELLTPYYFDNEAPPKEPNTKAPKILPAKKSSETDDNLSEFVTQFTHDKPKDNVYLLAAWIYSQHGLVTISSAQLRELASEIGVTIPTRPDMTMRSAKKKGKSLFKQDNSGYKPTVHGELYLKQTYSVDKGNKPLPQKDK